MADCVVRYPLQESLHGALHGSTCRDGLGSEKTDSRVRAAPLFPASLPLSDHTVELRSALRCDRQALLSYRRDHLWPPAPQAHMTPLQVVAEFVDGRPQRVFERRVGRFLPAAGHHGQPDAGGAYARVASTLRAMFLPDGFPHSVAPEYLQYQVLWHAPSRPLADDEGGCVHVHAAFGRCRAPSRPRHNAILLLRLLRRRGTRCRRSPLTCVACSRHKPSSRAWAWGSRCEDQAPRAPWPGRGPRKQRRLASSSVQGQAGQRQTRVKTRRAAWRVRHAAQAATPLAVTLSFFVRDLAGWLGGILFAFAQARWQDEGLESAGWRGGSRRRQTCARALRLARCPVGAAGGRRRSGRVAIPRRVVRTTCLRHRRLGSPDVPAAPGAQRRLDVAWRRCLCLVGGAGLKLRHVRQAVEALRRRCERHWCVASSGAGGGAARAPWCASLRGPTFTSRAAAAH